MTFVAQFIIQNDDDGKSIGPKHSMARDVLCRFVRICRERPTLYAKTYHTFAGARLARLARSHVRMMNNVCKHKYIYCIYSLYSEKGMQDCVAHVRRCAHTKKSIMPDCQNRWAFT